MRKIRVGLKDGDVFLFSAFIYDGAKIFFTALCFDFPNIL